MLSRLRTITACLLLTLLVLTGKEARAEVTITPAARAEFRKGVELLRDRGGPRYAEAYEAFQAAYAESPSPKILGNLGLCAMKLERDGEAIDAFQRYLDEAGAVNRREHRQILGDLRKLKKDSTPVVLELAPEVALVTDRRLPAGGAPVINEYRVKDGRLETRLRKGRHRIELEAEGYESATWSFELDDAPVEHQLTLTAIPQPEPVPPPTPDEPVEPVQDEGGFPSVGFIVSASVSGALGIAAGVVGGLALANKSSFDEAVAAGDTAEAASLRDTGQTLNGATDGLLVATGIAAGVTVVFLVLDLTSDDEDDEAVALAPVAGVDRLGVSLSGMF